MKISELIAWLQNLNPDYDIHVFNEETKEERDIDIIEEYEATRSYTIFPEE